MATVTGIKLVGLLEFPGLRLPGTEEGKLSTRLYDNQSKLIAGPSNFTDLRLAVGRYGLPSTSNETQKCAPCQVMETHLRVR